MQSEEILKETIGEDKLKKYRSLPSWYKFYKLLLVFLNLILWIGVIYLLINLLGNNDRYIGIFLLLRLFSSIPLNFYLVNWFVYILGKILGFTDKIEKFHKENNLPTFREAQKELFSVVVYLIPLYILFIVLLFIDLSGYSSFIFLMVFLLGILIEILWVIIKLKFKIKRK